MGCILLGACLALSALPPADPAATTETLNLRIEVQLLEWDGGSVWSPPANLQPRFKMNLPVQRWHCQTDGYRVLAVVEKPEWNGEALALTISVHAAGGFGLNGGATRRMVLRPGQCQLLNAQMMEEKRRVFAVILHRD